MSERTGIPKAESRLIFAGKELTQDKGQKTVADYNIQNESTLILCMRLKGGAAVKQPLNTTKDGDLTLEYQQPCIITLDDDEDNPRAKMPCGHCITPEGMNSLLKSIVDGGSLRWRILCPALGSVGGKNKDQLYCQAEWPYALCRRIGQLNAAEQQFFESKASENMAMAELGMVACPGCESFVFREDRNLIRATCVVCYKKKKREGAASATSAEFCYKCRRPWRGASQSVCGYGDCDQVAIGDIVAALASCKKKTISAELANVPEMRACPRASCRVMGIVPIIHAEKCKHMTCPQCKHQFCHSCLSVPDASGKWPCGAAYGKCPKGVAPIQTMESLLAK